MFWQWPTVRHKTNCYLATGGFAICPTQLHILVPDFSNKAHTSKGNHTLLWLIHLTGALRYAQEYIIYTAAVPKGNLQPSPGFWHTTWKLFHFYGDAEMHWFHRCCNLLVSHSRISLQNFNETHTYINDQCINRRRHLFHMSQCHICHNRSYCTCPSEKITHYFWCWHLQLPWKISSKLPKKPQSTFFFKNQHSSHKKKETNSNYLSHRQKFFISCLIKWHC